MTLDGSRVYVANKGSNTVSVIAPTTDKVITTIEVGSNPVGVAVTPDGSKVYVTNEVSSTVTVINTAMNTATAAIAVGPNPLGVSVTPDGSRVYVANSNPSGQGTVSVIDATKNTVTTTISAGVGPVAFGIFIQPPPRFAGTPGKANCFGQSVAALVRQFGGLNAAAAALGFPSISALQDAIMAFCGR